MDNNLTDLNTKWIRIFHKNRVFSIIYNTYQPQEDKTFCLASNKKIDIQEIVHAFKTDSPELWIKEYHDKSDLLEKDYDFSNVEEVWKIIDLVAYTSTLK
ncbi:17929_t:CDS:2 [Funneliformis geosporum]|nr:17929_t:CDS:2 [Funneliformis geosporum]